MEAEKEVCLGLWVKKHPEPYFVFSCGMENIYNSGNHIDFLTGRF